MAHAARHSPGLGEVSGWPLLPCRDQDSAAVGVGHMVSRHTLGAAQVHGRGLVTPPVLRAVMSLRTVYEMACFFVSFEGYVPVNMQFKFQQSVQMTVVVPRLHFIDRVGHCRYATVTGFLLVQTVQKTVVIRLCSSLARLFTSRCCATTGAMGRQCCLVEVPLLQFIDSRRHPCCGGPDSACGAPAVAVIDSRRHSNFGAEARLGFKLHEKLSLSPRLQFFSSF